MDFAEKSEFKFSPGHNRIAITMSTIYNCSHLSHPTSEAGG